MITEDYINFETAKLLKEKGFNEYCWKLYELGDSNKPVLLNGFDLDSESGFWNNKYLELYKKEHCHIKYNCSAPTLQMVMKWLRGVYKISIEVFYFTSNSDSGAWAFEIIKLPSGATVYGEYDKENYEQACETAIKYCLEKLV